MCKCIDLTHEEVRGFILSKELKSLPAVMQELGWKTSCGCPSCRPALNYYLLCAWPGEYRDDRAVALHQRAGARQHPEGRHVLGRPAHVGRRDHAGRAARDRRCRRPVQHPDREGDRRPAHRPARLQEGGPAGGVGAAQCRGPGVRPGLCQGPAHREDLRRQRMVPVRHPGFDRPRHQARALPVRLVDAGAR